MGSYGGEGWIMATPKGLHSLQQRRAPCRECCRIAGSHIVNQMSRPLVRWSSSVSSSSCARGSGIWFFEPKSWLKLKVVDGGRSGVDRLSGVSSTLIISWMRGERLLLAIGNVAEGMVMRGVV